MPYLFIAVLVVGALVELWLTGVCIRLTYQLWREVFHQFGPN